eukprot:3932821-Rhodomonas_salina.1
MLGGYALEQELGDFGSVDDEPIGVGEGSHDGGLSGVWGACDEGGSHAVGVVDDHRFRSRCWGSGGCYHLEDAASDGLVLVDRDGGRGHIEDGETELG